MARGFKGWKVLSCNGKRKSGIRIGCLLEASFQPNGFDGLSARGSHKAIARRLAEAGATPHEIMSVTGHLTLKEVERYAAAANRRAMAKSGMGRPERRWRALSGVSPTDAILPIKPAT